MCRVEQLPCGLRTEFEKPEPTPVGACDLCRSAEGISGLYIKHLVPIMWPVIRASDAYSLALAECVLY